MSRQQMHQFRTRLERSLAQLRPRRIDGLGLGAGDGGDQALSELEANLIAATVSADWRTAKEVRSALQRIASAEYGICETCEQSIPEVRLRALPWAARCTPCQQAVESELRAYAPVRQG